MDIKLSISHTSLFLFNLVHIPSVKEEERRETTLEREEDFPPVPPVWVESSVDPHTESA